MKARIFLLTISILIIIYPRSGTAQQVPKPVPRIGFVVSSGAPAHPPPTLEAFTWGLRELGYMDGRNVRIEPRYAEGRLNRIPQFVHEFVQQKVDIIVALNNVAIQAARQATKTIPIVMITSLDPVVAGYVESFARPGDNLTGVTTASRELSAKRVELLKEVFPQISRVSILWDADGPGPAVAFKKYQAAAHAFRVELRSVEIHGPHPDFVAALQAAKMARTDALIVVGNPLMAQHEEEIFKLATRHRLPSITEGSRYATAGSLISYGANRPDLLRHAANYVDRILKGAKPNELPVMLPTKFETYVNLKTAHQLGVALPQHVLVQADRVIR